jgi:hypothetical protein
MSGRGRGCDKSLEGVSKKESVGCKEEERGWDKAGRSEEEGRYRM